MIARLLNEQAVEQHLRSFNPYRDLHQLADLIEITFGSDLALTGSRMVHDMRQLALMGPMLSLTQRIAPILDGFVWYEGDRLVGNASMTPENQTGAYMLSNVAVLPEYRGRGIGGSLVDAAIARARAAGGKRVLLQVRTDHDGAIALYRHRGFERYDTLHEVNLRPSRWPISVGPRKAGLRPVRASDRKALHQLALASLPAPWQVRHPVRARDYARGLTWHLRQYLDILTEGRQQNEVLAQEEKRIVGLGRAKVCLWRGPHEFELYVAPDRRGAWEAALLSELLRHIPNIQSFSLRGSLSASHPEALEATAQLGFETLRILDQMSLDL